ncbi:hypothetical protein CQA01_26600 [Cyclobacterium qasimii]|uniref:Antitoxin n=3 Tax=Cyclobacterium qasimii TaxID=1350429 RepID=A0A512CD50_9BACT|nr:hypothetical protein CQA01_26600 [Cyclobacterium qasimii]
MIFLNLHVQFRAMDSKLTLKLDNGVIERAKMYAKEQNISLSKLIENYLDTLTKGNAGKAEVSPLVESLTGVVKLKEGAENRKYIDYLSNKYN